MLNRNLIDLLILSLYFQFHGFCTLHDMLCGRHENPLHLISIAWRLNVVIPFQHNEILDKRLPFVKISSIYIDTSDGINMFAQFEITSMDHFTRYFNLSFSHCDILERLNISHSFVLPPGISEAVNMTIAVPFYTIQFKDQKCKGAYDDFLIMIDCK